MPATLGMHSLISAFGIVVFIGLAWLMSSHKRRFPWRVVIGGLVLQFTFAALILKTKLGLKFFASVDAVFNRLIDCVDVGSRFVFGEGFEEHLFAFKVLPSIIFFAALMQVLYYLGIMQRIVRAMGFVVQRTLGTTGPESLASAANIFVGQTEAPLVVRPYVKSMTTSELMAIMVPGFGSTAGGVLIAYKAMGMNAGHLLTASVLSAPASLLIAKIIIPETRTSPTAGIPPADAEDIGMPSDISSVDRDRDPVEVDMGESGNNLLEAIAIGTLEGLKLTLNVAAMLIAFLALIALVNVVLGWVGTQFGYVVQIPFVTPAMPAAGWFAPLLPEVPPVEFGTWSLEAVFGWLFAPFAWLMGIPWQDCVPSGELLGVKMVANEFVAYLQLSTWKQPNSGMELDPRSVVILTY
ncbi:MAG TPA: nucleoside transporter C-terminal domain-containing protein, partial [Lacipirellulaceae bacterium]|nr:nucleoside transporter C-terminal domain-containing protein [Lacipirellulaceae bacterium]